VTPQKRWLLVTAAAAVAVYALLWIGIAQQWSWVTRLDWAALDAAHRYGAERRGWVIGWDVFCTALGPTAFRLVTVVLIIVAFARRNVRVGMFLLISVELSGLVIIAAKQAADRPRPSSALVSAAGSAFPSGHALGVMVGVLAVLTVVLPVLRRPMRGWAITLGAVVVVAIGAGRVVLNVHHPSDVLAGWALGYAYFALCLAAVPPWRPITEPDEIPEVPDTAR
jgi:undecaprenyl-diphosphatase